MAVIGMVSEKSLSNHTAYKWIYETMVELERSEELEKLKESNDKLEKELKGEVQQ